MMRLLAAVTLALAMMASPAFAAHKQSHHRVHASVQHRVHVASRGNYLHVQTFRRLESDPMGVAPYGAERDQRYAEIVIFGPKAPAKKHAAVRARAVTSAVAANAGATNDALVSEARRYIGTNPTGRGSLWCGAFMDMVLKRTGHAGGGNLASAYAHYGVRVSGPQVGAIAVMGRRGGGHVGVVSGVTPDGDPILISGNHNHVVAESVYPRSRIQVYVLPGGSGSG